MKRFIMSNRVWLALVAALLIIAPAAIAQTGDEESVTVEDTENGEAAEETSNDGVFVQSWEVSDDGLSFVITWSDSTTETVEVTDEEQDGLDHGDYVRSFEEAIPEHPGRGCVISQVARSDLGKPEEAESAPEGVGCPEGLYEWLNSEDKGSGPPPWAGGDDEGENGDGGEGEGDATTQGGPPAFVSGLGGRP